jgi:hypothetical protein
MVELCKNYCVQRITLQFQMTLCNNYCVQRVAQQFQMTLYNYCLQRVTRTVPYCNV